MALSKSEIQELAQDHGWSCENFPSDLCENEEHEGWHNMIESNQEIQLSGNAAKLHIGDVFSPDKGQSTSVLNLFSGERGLFNSQIPPNSSNRQNPPTEGVIQVPPGTFVYFLTEEVIRLPFNVCGQLFMNPEIANKGLLFFTTGHIAPGWVGRLTGTLLNMTNRTVYINRSDHVLYLSFLETGDDSSEHQPYSSHRSHSEPQLTIEDARSGELIHPDPGFARTTEFVTKRDLYEITIISLTALTVLVTILVSLLPSIIPTG